MAKATLTISSKNYSSWSLRGWLLTKFSGLDFEEIVTAPDDPSARAEILLLSPTILVPCLRHDGATIWDTLAIGEYLNETMPHAGLLPEDRIQRAHCRSICGEIHSGFTTLRSLWPMNARARNRRTAVTPALEADVERIDETWNDCRGRFGTQGPWLFGDYSVADAMYAPVVLRFNTYGARISQTARWYMASVLEDAALQEWLQAARLEPWTIAADEVG